LKKLERQLSLTSVIAISIGGMLGSGIFVLPGIAAAKTGPSVWMAYLLAAICILPAALSKSELSSAMPKSGGTYVYIERVFGPILGTISGIGLWLSLLLKSSFALVGFGAYLLVLIQIPESYIKIIAITFLVLIMLLNILGVKKVGKVQIAIVSLSILGLIILVFSGFPSVNKQLLTPFMYNGTTGLISTVAFVYISYAGVTKIAAIAGEVKNPRRNIPLGMLLSLVIVTIIYVSISYVLVGNIHIQKLAYDIKPIYSLAYNIGGPNFGYIFAIIGVITLISMANSGVLATSRFPFAMALDKLLPQQLGKVHKTHLTPVNTILLTCVIMTIVIIFLDVEKIAKLASAFKVMMFISVNICVIVLRETAVQWYEPKFLSPFYPFIQLFGIFSGLVLLFFLGWMSVLAILCISIIGIIVYLIWGKNASRTGVLKKYGHRPALFIFFNQKAKYKHLKAMSEREEYISQQINIPNDTGVIVPLLGNEKSPEMLLEIGASINTRKKIQAVNITEVPDQTLLEAIAENTSKTKSIQRQIQVLSKKDNLEIEFESVVTHNIAYTIQSLSTATYSDWLVFGWNGRAYNGILFSNPLGWIVSNINSNFALFKDNGGRYIARVLLAVRPDSFVIVELIKTTEKLCKFYNASFTLLHVVNNKTTDLEIEEINKKANELLRSVLVNTEVQIIKSENSTERVSEISAEYDLLVLGTPQKENMLSILFGTGKDKFAIKSNCSVLRLTVKT